MAVAQSPSVPCRQMPLGPWTWLCRPRVSWAVLCAPSLLFIPLTPYRVLLAISGIFYKFIRIFHILPGAAPVSLPCYTLKSVFYHMPLFLSSDLHFPAKRCKLTQFFYSLCLSKVMFELGAAGALIKFAFHLVACSGTVCGACEISIPKGL